MCRRSQIRPNARPSVPVAPVMATMRRESGVLTIGVPPAGHAMRVGAARNAGRPHHGSLYSRAATVVPFDGASAVGLSGSSFSVPTRLAGPTVAVGWAAES